MADDAYAGQLGAPDANNLTGLVEFIVRQALGLVHTGIPVKVVKVHGGGVGPAPTVDVLPLVNMVDGLGKRSTKHTTVYGLPVARNQGGKSAVINDPQVGDIGWVSVANRDISKVKKTAAQADPDSFRRFSLSDGMYHGAIINPANPNQYIQFKTNGIVIHDANGNEIGLQNSDPHIYVKPGSGMVYLGGDGTTGTFDFVETVSGPSINVKARIS